MGIQGRRSGILAVLATLVVCACERDAEMAAPIEPAEADVVAARAAAEELGSRLKRQLIAAMETGGPTSAIGVCRQAAPAIASRVSNASGVTMARTSLRVRNPANAADEWEREQLVAFAEAHAAGADLASLERSAIVREDDRAVFRWIKPIAMGEVCAQCHGSSIEPDVAKAIARLYPADQATGFALGEVRGAFTARKIVSPPGGS